MLFYPIDFGHNTFHFNEHLSAAGVPDNSKVKDTVLVKRIVPDTDFRDLREPYHLATGGGLGRVHKGMTKLDIFGEIRVPDGTKLARMADRERAMRAAFDPSLCYRDSSATEGAYALDFSESTLDTANYPTGRIDQRYYARPLARPRITTDLESPSAKPFVLSVVAPDPRAYERTEQTLVLSSGVLSGNAGNLGTVPAPLKATITMGGAGNAAFTITRSGVAFILNLSGLLNGDVVVVVFETCGPYLEGRKVTKNAARAFSLKTSGPSTWLDVPVGSTTFTLTNAANVTSCVLAWYPARA